MISDSLANRPAAPSDIAFIVDSWSDSYRTSYSAGPLPMPLYQRIMRECIGWLIQRHEPQIIIAYNPTGDPGRDIYGWLAVERGMIAPQRIREGGRYVTRTMPLGPVVHYLYVKEPFRRIGVASYLMRTAGVDLKADWSFTHKTAASTRITKRLAPQATYNPLLARFDKTQTQEALNAAE